MGAIALAGCGGSSSAPVTGASGASGASGISGSSQLTKSEFIKQADGVCAEANTAIADLTGGASTGDEASEVTQELSIVRSELQSIQALPAPSEDKSTLKDFIAGLKNEVDALNRKNSALAAGEDTTAADSELATARTNAEQAASDYGMKDCGTGKARHTQAGATTTVPTTATTTTAVPTTPSVPTTTTSVPNTTTPTAPPAPEPPPPSGGTGGGTGGGSGGGTGGGTGSGGTGGSGGVSP